LIPITFSAFYAYNLNQTNKVSLQVRKQIFSVYKWHFQAGFNHQFNKKLSTCFAAAYGGYGKLNLILGADLSIGKGNLSLYTGNLTGVIGKAYSQSLFLSYKTTF
jgi:hypothetical protein